MNSYWKYIVAAVVLVAATSWFTPVANAAAPRTVSGIIEKIDPLGHSLTIKGLVLSKTFQVSDTVAVIATGSAVGSEAKLADLKVGDKVEVTYEKQGGVLTASRIALKSAATKSQGYEEKTQSQQPMGETPPASQTPPASGQPSQP